MPMIKIADIVQEIGQGIYIYSPVLLEKVEQNILLNIKYKFSKIVYILAPPFLKVDFFKSRLYELFTFLHLLDYCN
jgi:hypothetical protein